MIQSNINTANINRKALEYANEWAHHNSEGNEDNEATFKDGAEWAIKAIKEHIESMNSCLEKTILKEYFNI